MADNTPTTTAVSGNLPRSYHLLYIDASFGKGNSPQWFLIGKHVQELRIELNHQVDDKNILDEAIDNGYEPSADVDTYRANNTDAIYEKIKDIALNRKTGDDCRTKILEVIINGKSANGLTATGEGWVENVFVNVQNYGGAGGQNSSLEFPYNLIFEGNRQAGTVAISNKVPTFTPAAA